MLRLEADSAPSSACILCSAVVRRDGSPTDTFTCPCSALTRDADRRRSPPRVARPLNTAIQRSAVRSWEGTSYGYQDRILSRGERSARTTGVNVTAPHAGCEYCLYNKVDSTRRYE
jgi:hypothetical protein